jgi:hypothetical protein
VGLIQWITTGEKRGFRAGSELHELKAINAQESEILANTFFGVPFIKSQLKFLWRKKKLRLTVMFLTMLFTRPLWSKFLIEK